LEVFPAEITNQELRKLEASTRLLFKNTVSLGKRTDTRHLGTWPDYQPYFFYTAEARAFPESVRFLENKNTIAVTTKLNNHLRHHFKGLHDKYKHAALPLEMRLVGRAFPTLAVNSAPSSPHYDDMDCKEGICYVLPYGSFEGGELVFRDFKLRIQCQPGSIIAFDSEGLFHENLPITKGERFSLVMFCHQGCLTKANQIENTP
jgi:hypothetical protein